MSVDFVARSIYYRVRPSFGGGRFRIDLENKSNLLEDGALVIGPPAGERGFPKWREKPRFLLDHRLGRMPRDIEMYSEYWLVSERLRLVLQSVDSDGCVFFPCDITSNDGLSVGVYWLCDIVRVIDALDELRSKVHIGYFGDKKVYNLVGQDNLYFKKSLIEEAHIFRMEYMTLTIIADTHMKRACKLANIGGISFSPAHK